MRLMDISQPAANVMFGLSNIALIAGAILVLLGSVGVFWSGSVRERYADERVSENEAKAASAIAESARANESNTRLKLELERERVERLRLEKKVAPRQLTDHQRSTIISGLRSTGWEKAEIIWHGTGEPEAYARDFAKAFETAGIDVQIHTLGMFIPSAWGLMVVITPNNVSERLKALLDKAGVKADLAETNDTIGEKRHPTLFIGSREDEV